MSPKPNHFIDFIMAYISVKLRQFLLSSFLGLRGLTPRQTQGRTRLKTILCIAASLAGKIITQYQESTAVVFAFLFAYVLKY